MTELLVALAAGGLAALASGLRVLREYERMVRVPLRIVTMDIPPQDVITRDNVSVKVNAVVYFRVNDPVAATIEVENYLFATSQLAQTTLRSVIGQAELDQLLAEREHFNKILRQIIDEGTDLWGVEVVAVEIKDIDLPQEMKRAMARQAEAERERRAKVIAAEGELQASAQLAEAARVISRDPAAIQLRFLQTVAEIATENNSTTLFPIPIDLFRPFLQRAPGSAPAEAARPARDPDAPELPTAAAAPTALPAERVTARPRAGTDLDPLPSRKEDPDPAS